MDKLDELESETKKLMRAWLKKSPPKVEFKKKIWQPLADYKSVGSFIARPGEKRKPRFGKEPRFDTMGYKYKP